MPYRISAKLRKHLAEVSRASEPRKPRTTYYYAPGPNAAKFQYKPKAWVIDSDAEYTAFVYAWKAYTGSVRGAAQAALRLNPQKTTEAA